MDDNPDANQKSWLRKPLNFAHGILAAIFFVLGIVLIPPFVISGRVEEYQYDNVHVQRDIVDKRVAPVEESVRYLGDRMTTSEIKINAQLTDSQHTQRKLEELMYKADPDTLTRMMRNELGASVHQTANPNITVAPIINNSGK